jgi:cytochrome c553
MPRFQAIPALLIAIAAGFVAPAFAGAAPTHGPAARPAKLGLCVSCHGEDGRARIAGTPHLAGQDEAYLRKALSDFRSGARNAAPMNAIAGTLQAKDIQALAHWFATRPAPAK